jgi:G3E family GTPase
MAVATFDTLKFANTLKAAGVPPQQAEAQAVAFAEVIQLNLKELVTKEDLKHELEGLKKELKTEVLDARKDGKYELKEAEQRLTNKIELLAAKVDATATDMRASMVLLRWMIGVNAMVVVTTLGLVLRYFIFRGVP